MGEEEQLTPQDMEALQEAMKGYGSPQVEEKFNVHTFLNKVLIAQDTTKVGYLNEQELGWTEYSLRKNKKLALDSGELANDDIWESYFNKSGEIITATSLSKEAKFIGLAVLQRKELADMTKPQKENKGWFKSKDKSTDNQQQS
jgi:hypothetical protein